MTHRDELAHYLENYLSASEFEDYGPNGLQVEGKESIKTCATAVSASLETIEKAVEAGVDALIVHHGLFWMRDDYCIIGPKRERLAALLKHEISLFAYHLPLDAHQEVGNNFRAAQDLGWHSLEPFSVGVKGRFKSMPLDAFIAELEAYYGHSATVALGGKKSVQSAILISGGAYKELATAAKEGVDCFITGNFDEPAWAAAHEGRINFFALGHTATEKIGPQALAEHIDRKFGVSCTFIDSDNVF